MALVLKDRVKETTTTTGTADFTLGGAATGFQSFSVIGNGNTTYYAAVDPTTGDWEVGVGTYSTTGPTLTRDSVLESSNAGSKVVFAAGSKDVFCTYPAERSVNLDAAGSAVTILDIGTLGVSTANISTANITSGTVSTTPTSSTDIANKTYVDTQVSSGITYHLPVKYEVPSTTGNLTANYNQPGGPGVGVGATLTNAGTLAAFAPDGPTAQVGDRILVYNQTNAFENGVYTVTTVGSGAVAWVLTRATDADTYALKSPNGLGLGDAFFVTSGDTGAGETYVCNTSGTITFGTTNITFVQISSAQVYSAGTGLNLSPATTFNISNTGVTASTYGSGSNVPVFAVNAQGQITSVTNTAIAISAGAVSGLAASATTDTTDATNITSGTLPSGRLNGSYTGVTGVGTLTAGTWNGSTIAAAYGGTGLSSYAVGDLIYANTTTSLAKLADVASGNVLLSGGVGTAPAWGQVGLQTHVTGTLQVTNGGTGATTLTGYVKGNGTSAFTASASIPNSDTTATSANTANTIVARDSSGNFSAGTITANLSGNATTATSATSATTATQVANSLTFATSGTGLSGSGSFNGSSAQTFTVTSNATSANTASTIVARDASGNFSAGTITASLSGNASTATSATSATTATNIAGGVAGAVPYQSGSGATGFSAAGSSGQYLQSNGASAPSWITPPTIGDGTLTMAVSGTGLSGSASFTANQSGNTTFTVTSNATSANTASTIVARDASGNFSAGTITASLSGNASTATSATTAVNLSPNRTNWSTNGNISAVVGQLGWKNYGNSHTIFDASNSTSPCGTSVNNTDSQIAWGGSYPTLMGWNGANTYGVRVDSARLACNSAKVGAITPVQFFNNMGNNHGTYTNFNSFGDFGFRYMQGSTNGPFYGIYGPTQFYGMTLGLGNEYSSSQYASQLYWPRLSTGITQTPYISVRFLENGSWSSWSKIYAGYADTAGYACSIAAATPTVRGSVFGKITSCSCYQHVYLGYNAGGATSNSGTTSVGWYAGYTCQSVSTVAVGKFAGYNAQGYGTVAVGACAGNYNQQAFSVGIGLYGGYSSQGTRAVGIGYGSHYYGSGSCSVAVGYQAGNYLQGTGAVAIGRCAGASVQGSYAVAIGFVAGSSSQHSKSIIINATCGGLSSGGSNRFYVKPIRNANLSYTLKYDPTTGEITYI
jgi:hypothetical protein